MLLPQGDYAITPQLAKYLTRWVWWQGGAGGSGMMLWSMQASPHWESALDTASHASRCRQMRQRTD